MKVWIDVSKVSRYHSEAQNASLGTYFTFCRYGVISQGLYVALT